MAVREEIKREQLILTIAQVCFEQDLIIDCMLRSWLILMSFSVKAFREAIFSRRIYLATLTH